MARYVGRFIDDPNSTFNYSNDLERKSCDGLLAPPRRKRVSQEAASKKEREKESGRGTRGRMCVEDDHASGKRSSKFVI